MKKAVGALAGAAMFLGGAGVAGATEFARGVPAERPPMTLSPETGVPGSSFTLSGADCTSGEVYVIAPGPYVQNSTPEAVVAPDGSWTAEFTLADNVGPDVTVRIEADCLESGGAQSSASAFRGAQSENILFEYQTAYFTVVEDPTLTLSPESGEPGSTFTVSGGTCFNQFADEEVTVTAGGETQELTANSDDGTWSATFDVPDDAAIGSTIDVEATCAFPNYDDDLPTIRRAPSGEAQVDTFDYDTAVFTVTGETTTTGGTTTATGAVGAAAATPTTATPTFTG
ncbi:hypothetical protein [Actinospongicola halichondriae]|uniref:hypothetical protein n=1 Tax=Actinospongicola halichondriae TaxID=3236844 RepID=UPI003D426339